MRKVLCVFAAVLLILCSGCGAKGSDKTDKTAGELLSIVLDAVQFPQLLELTDEDRITEDLGIDLSLVEDYAVMQQMLSVDVSEIIILVVKDGSVGELKDVLETRKESLINDFAFYPNQVASAEATRVGSVKNVVYLICHEEAEVAEQALLAEVDE